MVLGPEHAMASAAIPLLFRSALAGDEYFCDGLVRQNTPLTPALHLGADRVMVLSLQHRPRLRRLSELLDFFDPASAG